MLRRGIRPVLVLTAAIAAPAHAYQLTPPEYSELSVLPAWDNEGRLPEGRSKLSELEWIDRDIEEREARLRSRNAMILRMEQGKTTDGVKSMRADYDAQVESFERWRESMDRRRQAIIDSADKRKATERKPAVFQPSANN